jgi:hypothetical protein
MGIISGVKAARPSPTFIAPEALDQARRDADRAVTRQRASARHLTSAWRQTAATLSRTAEALEQSAALAEDHSRRNARQGRSSEAASEHEVAGRARRAAERARLGAAEAAQFVPGAGQKTAP